MFGLGPATRIYVALGATDMRKGFDGLYGMVRDKLGLEVRSGPRQANPCLQELCQCLQEAIGNPDLGIRFHVPNRPTSGPEPPAYFISRLACLLRENPFLLVCVRKN